MFQNCRMNFRLAYKPRARLPTVNPCAPKKWSGKTRLAFKLIQEIPSAPFRGGIFVERTPMNYQAPSGATLCLIAKNMPLVTELFGVIGAILQICRAAGALNGNGDFTATIFRGVADGWWPSARTSSVPGRRRGCRRTEMARRRSELAPQKAGWVCLTVNARGRTTADSWSTLNPQMHWCHWLVHWW